MSSSPIPLARAVCASMLLLLGCQTVNCAAKNNKPTHKIPPKAVDSEFANFTQWQEVRDFIEMMVSKHQFERTSLEATLKEARYIDSAVKLIKPAPVGKAKNWALYRSRFVEPIRINAGLQFWQANAETLAKAEAEFGVPAEIIVSIIGVETIFGRNTGNFRVMDVVTTLAFSYPDTPKRAERSSFFRGELENALILARENGIDPFSMRGSYAGAIGLPQFMPSSIRNFGVDYDGDGKIDLRNSSVDAIGSVAHFLQQHGWQKNIPLAFSATVTQGDNPPWAVFLEQGLEAKYSPQEIRQAGIGIAADVPENLHYGLIDLQNGNSPTEYWLGTNNFFAITRYNRSYFYAMSVIELGQAIKNAKKR